MATHLIPSHGLCPGSWCRINSGQGCRARARDAGPDQAVGRRPAKLTDMSQPNTKHNLAVAIEILTAMYVDRNSVSFALDRIEKLEEERGKEGIMEAFSGLLQLCTYGASELGRLTGRTELQVLQNFALNIQDESRPPDPDSDSDDD
jgi:hypothetical protein